MNRSDLTGLIAKQTSSSTEKAELGVRAILNNLSIALGNQQRIEVRGFGAFTLRKLPARKARNPKTGEKLQLKPRQGVHFKPGKALKERVDGSREKYDIIEKNED